MKSYSDGSYDPVSEFKLRERDDEENGAMALWPEGSELIFVCSWTLFLQIWKAYLPNLKIKPPSLDTCNLCDKFAKYMIAKKQSQMSDLPKFLNNNSLLCPKSNKLSLLDEEFGD